MTFDEAKEVLMWGALRGYTEEDIAEARGVVYSGQTEGGLLLTPQAIETSGYEETDQGGVYSGGPTGTSYDRCGPSPQYRLPPLYPAEECAPRDVACVGRNEARQNANFAIKHNADIAFKEEKCRHNECLNGRDLGCEGQFGSYWQVPQVPGESPVVVARDDLGILRPVSGIPIPNNQTLNAPGGNSANQPTQGDYVATNVGQQNGGGSSGFDVGYVGDWLQGEGGVVAGLPNWMLLAGAGLLLFMGRGRMGF